MSGLTIPGSDATAATQDLIKDQTDKTPRIISGVIEILEDTGVTIPASIERIQSGTVEILNSVGNQTSGSIARLQSGIIEIFEDTGITIPASIERIQSGTVEILNSVGNQTSGSIARLQSGIIEIFEDTGITIPESIERIQSGIIELVPSLITDLQKTVYDSNVVSSGLQFTGSAWLTVLDVNSVSYPTKLAAITLTTSGDLIGAAKYRITDDSEVKVFPHIDENIVNNGTEDVFTHTIDVPNAGGYKVQVRTTSVDDTSGKTASLSQLNIIELQ